ncbi:hypothetical protein HTS88_15645 [Pseudarthrobacter oxydans]|uniref:HGGxSTG domain-containing protein n=1 Tax=Pseudarthrobacter oxydans TaxID=1671 RepID=UPI001574807B|nr:HGGxSTG domain-containing protein [Pseudarthrobacter oxydans]NSX37817.1 hypothetical protein [Pseudarthrobacter oxydans]
MKNQCGAKAKGTGERCKRAPIAGGTVCRVHGGASSSVKAAAARRAQEEAARQQLMALGEPEDIDPSEALLRLISWKYGEVKWLRQRVQNLPGHELTWGVAQTDVGLTAEGPIDKVTERAAPSVWWALLRQAEDQLANYAERALRAGIEERKVRIAEQQGDLVAAVMMNIFQRLALTPEQWEAVHVVTPQELRKLAA